MGIKFFKKNKIDLSIPSVTITVTDNTATNDGQETVDRLRNRSNFSGFATTGSDDAANTTLEVDTVDEREYTHIMLIKHNFKNYSVQYWNGSTYVNFSTAINVTNNTEETTWHEFDLVSTSRIRYIITGTMVADSDKFLAQLIQTELIGEFTSQPDVSPLIEKNKKVTRYLSGRKHITRNISAFSVSLKKNNVVETNDLEIQEQLFENFEGFLVWLCGGDVTQYPSNRVGYRLEDIFLVNCENEFQPKYARSRWSEGMEIDMKLVEVN